MSRAKMYQIDVERLKSYVTVAGDPRKIAKSVGWDEYTLHRAYRQGQISGIFAKELEKATKIKLEWYKATDGRLTTEDEHTIRLTIEALKRYEREKR